MNKYPCDERLVETIIKLINRIGIKSIFCLFVLLMFNVHLEGRAGQNIDWNRKNRFQSEISIRIVLSKFIILSQRFKQI